MIRDVKFLIGFGFSRLFSYKIDLNSSHTPFFDMSPGLSFDTLAVWK
jgi:hypothetical protein